MLQSVIPAILAVALTACGGGGGGASQPAAQPDAINSNSIPTLGAILQANDTSMVTGRFKGDQTQYLAVAHYKFFTVRPGVLDTEPGPVKIYQLNDDGTMLDSTVEILGGAVSARTNVPLVADFNHDGIDDLFLPGFSDTQDLVPSIAFISRPGRSHIRVDLPDPVYAHGAAVLDVNNDGHVDVMSSWGEVWLNDGTGSFRFRTHSYRDVPGFWIHGSGVCAGDFYNVGRSQIVLVDQMVNSDIGPIADTVIFELDNAGLPTAHHFLPVPILDRNSTTTEKSHDVTCLVTDFNNDGKQDVIVFSRPLPEAGGSWTNQGRVQLLLNRGAWQFEDVTDQLLVGYDTNVMVSYTAKLIDLNGDGKLDLWCGYFDFDTGKSNQALLNNGNGGFTRTQKTLIDNFSASGGMLPIKFGNKWAFVFMKMTNGTSQIYFTKPLYTFN